MVRGRAALAVACLLPVVVLLAPIPAGAGGGCYLQDCDAACGSSWTGFTTLISDPDYPDNFDTPIAFVDPGDGLRQRLVATLEGKIWVWDAATGEILATPYLDLSGKIATDHSERGLLALAVDPDFVTSGYLYVFYTRGSLTAADHGDLVVERYTRLTDQTADPASAQPILVIDHSFDENHNGGWLAFGTDGMLYLSTGDGGGGCDDDANGTPRAPNGQNVETLLGALLRLDVRGEDPSATAPECGEGSGAYGVPTDNPFAGATAGCGEIWAYGLRNPWRYSFDRETGDLWIGDVGQADWEEVNFLAADYYPLAPDGAMNFGWKCREGCENFASSCGSADCPAELVGGISTCEYPKDVDPGAGEILYWDPVLCHDNRDATGPAGSDWQSVVGGYRYRGPGVPALYGRYLYGDAYCGQLWISTAFSSSDPAATTAACWDGGNQALYSFAEDRQGELYLLFADGDVVCVHAGGGCPWADGSRIFADGFERDSTAGWSLTEPAP